MGHTMRMVHKHVLLLTEQHSDGLKSFFLALRQSCSMLQKRLDGRDVSGKIAELLFHGMANLFGSGMLAAG